MFLPYVLDLYLKSEISVCFNEIALHIFQSCLPWNICDKVMRALCSFSYVIKISLALPPPTHSQGRFLCLSHAVFW
uniref:Uncharacterized protein n=1 Tax=Nelumbo nucifera TaxID=4432 RepID=A0A822YMK3_NELNU|nr:TPA_asm: hypothetical protein HUJ06_006044 [Nelumbo nucifera]